MIIVSACLLGEKCRYDGNHKRAPELLKLLEDDKYIAVCPEQLGGLTTPRDPAEKVEDKLITINGKDVTLNYKKGAKEALRIALQNRVTKAYLKSKSPMCGHGKIYDGNFSGTLKDGDGVFTKMCKVNGIDVKAID